MLESRVEVYIADSSKNNHLVPFKSQLHFQIEKKINQHRKFFFLEMNWLSIKIVFAIVIHVVSEYKTFEP